MENELPPTNGAIQPESPNGREAVPVPAFGHEQPVTESEDSAERPDQLGLYDISVMPADGETTGPESKEHLRPEPAQPSRTGRFLGTVRELVETVVLALLIFLAVRSVVQNFRVEGSSMYPSFLDGQYVLVNKAVYAEVDLSAVTHWIPFLDLGGGESFIFHPPRRGDVIVFHPPPPNDPTRDFIKRVVAVPGDTVEIYQGRLWVNGQAVAEPFIHQATLPLNPRFTRMTLGPDQYYVLGDNRGNSSDSRAWGPIQSNEVVGRAWLIYWPASAWKVAPNQPESVPAASITP